MLRRRRKQRLECRELSLSRNTIPCLWLWLLYCCCCCFSSSNHHCIFCWALEPEKGNGSSTPNGINHNKKEQSSEDSFVRLQQLLEGIEDSFYDPVQADPDCQNSDNDEGCWSPPQSTLDNDNDNPIVDASCAFGGADPDANENEHIGIDNNAKESSSKSNNVCLSDAEERVVVDKHWGRDPAILKLRDRLRQTGSGQSNRYRKSKNNKNGNENGNNANADDNNDDDEKPNRRPPIFLLPGLASTRLVAWKPKSCAHLHPWLTDVKVGDTVWLNMNFLVQMGTLDVRCWIECLKLGWNQTDNDDPAVGCKLRPDEGLDAISSLSPGTGLPTKLLVGGTNTVYAWLVQWLADHLGYDVTNLLGLPYDWRLAPPAMQQRDGFLTHTRRRMEAMVQHAQTPGIVVAHSMGNAVFRYFLAWLHMQLQEETYQKLVKSYEARQKARSASSSTATTTTTMSSNSNNNPTGYMGWAATKVDEFLHRRGDDASTTTQPNTNQDTDAAADRHRRAQLRELAKLEGTAKYHAWLERHVWTYVGLSAPLLGAVNPLRAVISGETMGIPGWDEAQARQMEVTFGSTHTVNPISTQSGFCDEHDFTEWDEVQQQQQQQQPDSQQQPHHANNNKLACLDDIVADIEQGNSDAHHYSIQDPWQNYPALQVLLKDRVDWDSDHSMIRVIREQCQPKEKPPCSGDDDDNANIDNNEAKKGSANDRSTVMEFGPRDVESGKVFDVLASLWQEEGDPLIVKKEQLAESFWNTNVPNMLNSTWERPLIKHVIMAYGVDVPTEVGYTYRKSEVVEDSMTRENTNKETAGSENNKDEDNKSNRENNSNKKDDGVPNLSRVLWEEPGGNLSEEHMEVSKGGLGDILTGAKKKVKRRLGRGRFKYSGDGSIPYLSLIWSHTWLLHAARAARYEDGPTASTYANPGTASNDGRNNHLNGIQISHRPKGGTEWIQGPPPTTSLTASTEKKVEESKDTGTAHPHGTKYKPEMTRFHSAGKSRSTGIEYTTTVIEAVGVEHKETTRNYDILAAVFTDVLRKMHDDLEIV